MLPPEVLGLTSGRALEDGPPASLKAGAAPEELGRDSGIAAIDDAAPAAAAEKDGPAETLKAGAAGPAAKSPAFATAADEDAPPPA